MASPAFILSQEGPWEGSEQTRDLRVFVCLFFNVGKFQTHM